MIPADNKEISMLQRRLRQIYLELKKVVGRSVWTRGTMLCKPRDELGVTVGLPDAEENCQFL